MINLVINSKSLLAPMTGIGRYTYEIVRRLSDSQDFDITYFYGRLSKDFLFREGSCNNVASKKTVEMFIRDLLVKNASVKSFSRNLLEAYLKIFAGKFDLYWEPGIVPLDCIKSRKTVVTVHDMSLHMHKEWHTSESVSYFEKRFFQNIDKADIIITDTHTVKDEVVKTLGFPEDRIRPIFLAPDSIHFYPRNDAFINKLRENFNINYKFILYVGSIEPRKNLKRLIDAYSLLDKNIKDEYKLLLVGYKGWNNKEIHSLVEKEKDYIKYLGYVSNEELAGLYSSTSVFAYMSLYEGFGLPPLEAMACGAPVLTSDIPCIREVCGDVALYADPWSIDSIFESLKQVINDGVLQKELSDKGLKHSKKFNWDITADKHISIFKELL